MKPLQRSLMEWHNELVNKLGSLCYFAILGDISRDNLESFAETLERVAKKMRQTADKIPEDKKS